MAKEEIRSQSKFLWQLLIEILKLPITLILVITGKKSSKDLLTPFTEIIKFLIEAKLTLALIMINIVLYFTITIFFKGYEEQFLQYPIDLFSSRIYTIITAGFMHANLGHLFGNMLGLFIFGRICEQKLGTAKTALIYFGALIISGIFTSLINLFMLSDNTPGLGASGALMGLISTAILISPFSITYEAIIPIPIMLAGWLTIWADMTSIINPTEDGIGHFAHLGGFISIALLAFALGVEDRKKIWHGLLINLGCLAITILLYFLVLKS